MKCLIKYLKKRGTCEVMDFSSTILVQLSRKFRMPGTVVRMLKGRVDSSTKNFYIQLKYCLGLPQVFCVTSQ